ncbi:MAG TPA: hypothetical protein VLG11_04470 [Candidatus Saccharimonadales bacterium]|nr:hypothetical protein [Candidatus Saccharimonadales bacterium]
MSNILPASAHREKTIYFDLPDTDNLRMRADLRGGESIEAIAEQGKPLAVIVPGNTAYAYSGLYLGCAHTLLESGIPSLRLSYCDTAPDTRNYLTNTFKEQLEDTTVVLEELKRRAAPELHAIGHSVGALAILSSPADHAIDSAVLWETSHGSFFQQNPIDSPKFPNVQYDDYLIYPDGHGDLTSRTAFDFLRSLGDTTSRAKGHSFPTMFVAGGKSGLRPYAEQYFTAADGEKGLGVIPDATHNFEGNDIVAMREMLYRATATWISENSALLADSTPN